MKSPTSSNAMLLISFWLLLNIFTFVTAHEGLGFILSTLVQPDGCFGGEVCDIQPTVAVIDPTSGQIQYSFVGSVYVAIENSPTGYEYVYTGGSGCNNVTCGQQVFGSYASASFVEGVAYFEDMPLHFSTAGTYTLKFIGRNGDDDEFAFTFSEEFDVLTGESYKLLFSNYVGTAFGGQPFLSNPVVALADRGGNVIETEHNSVVTVRLVLAPTSTATLEPSDQLSVEMSGGLATFEGLLIDKAGYAYRLEFEIDKPGIAPLISRDFDVVVGLPAQLEFDENYRVSTADVIAGEYFSVPPRVRLLDAGGNLVADDSESAILVSFFSNSHGGTVGPDESLFVTAQQGIVSFNSIRIDKKGSEYTLLFTLYNYSSLAGEYTETNVQLVSERFTVLQGPPRQLIIARPAAEAWAGNQIFHQQPRVYLTDYGQNVVDSEFEAVAVASVVNSLSVFKDIIIDTTNANTTEIVGITVNLEDGEVYGAGQRILFTVHFSAKVWFQMSQISLRTPYLVISIEDDTLVNGTAVSGDGVIAYLLVDGEDINLDGTYELVFEYIVKDGDSEPVALSIVSSTIDLEGSRLLDGNDRDVSVEINEDYLSSKLITVDTTPPVITNVEVSTSGGDGSTRFGEGQLFIFAVIYNVPVVVTGTPYFNLTVEHAENEIVATFSEISEDGRVLFFTYSVGPGEYSTDLNVEADTLQFRLFNVTEWTLSDSTDPRWENSTDPSKIVDTTWHFGMQILGSIKRLSTTPTTYADYHIPTGVISIVPGIEIDSVTDIVLSEAYQFVCITCVNETTYQAGDELFFTVQWSEPVVTEGVGIYLHLNMKPEDTTGSCEGRAYVSQLDADMMTMEFMYRVESTCQTTKLTVDGIFISGEDSYVKRVSTSPSMDVSLMLNTSAWAYQDISLNGFGPVVQSVDMVQPVPAVKDLYPDDAVNITVVFSGPVVATCSPVLVIASGYYRNAIYVAGNMTNEFTFQYTVHVGDRSNNSVAYRHTPMALCTVAGCPRAERTECRIWADSDNPYVDADLYLNRQYLSADVGTINGVRISDQRIHPTADRNTTILSIESTASDGAHAPGSVIEFDVTFEDIVVLPTPTAWSELPKLQLNNGKFAEYVRGNRDRILTFRYISTMVDVFTEEGLTAAVINGTFSALNCSSRHLCDIRNEANQPVDLDTTIPGVIIPSAVTLDPTAPVILDVWTDEVTSPYNGKYSMGQVIVIYVSVSRPVIITGFDPRILMDVGTVERYALYAADISTTTQLAFNYTVGAGDLSMDLAYAELSLDLYGGHSYILAKSEIPELLLDPTLPPLQKTVSVEENVVRVDAVNPPRVVSVAHVLTAADCSHAVSPGAVPWSLENRTMAAGDCGVIRIEFSTEVIAAGNSYLTLNLGDRVRYAMYIGYLPSENFELGSDYSNVVANWTWAWPKTYSNGTKYLYYRYIVEEGDISGNLDYVDVFSLFVGVTDSLDVGYIVHAATIRAGGTRLDAVLDLVPPGEHGSLSNSDGTNTTKIRVDGRAAYLTSIEFVNDPGTYQVGDTIYIALMFSARVYVTPTMIDPYIAPTPPEYTPNRLAMLREEFILTHVTERNITIGTVLAVDPPSILLETGKVDNEAVYVSGSGSSTLIFAYSPEAGDMTANLEYHAERTLYNSAINSFSNEEFILTYSANPILPAKLHLNPPRGHLQARNSILYPQTGNSTILAEAGCFDFDELLIAQRGPDYELRYSSQPTASEHILTTVQDLYVDFSGEFQLWPLESRTLKDKRVGEAVAIDGDMAIIGAPYMNNSVTTIQTVTTTAALGFPTKQVLTIKTTVAPQPAIQTFHTTADVGETVGGFWVVNYGTFGPSTPIPANADPDQIAAILLFDLQLLGNITVTKEAYIYCACNNAFTWTLTFNDINQGVFLGLTIDTSGLTGAGADIIGPTTLQSSALLGGTFNLEAPTLGTVSSQIPFDATVAELDAAINELGLSAYEIQITSYDIALTRAWAVTFNAYLDSYETPEVVAHGEGTLTGGDADVWTLVTRPGLHGPLGIAGYFQLEWRGNTTRELLPTTSAAEMKDALEELPIINFVNVNRSSESYNPLGGYTWTIEFVSVNTHDNRGYHVNDETENLEPIIPINNLIATNGSIIVESQWFFNDSYSIYDVARQGTLGDRAGAAYLFQRINESWVQNAVLVGNDTVTNNFFGGAVGISGDAVIVGAVGGNMNGVPEKQSVFCNANSGSFLLNFRGWSTDPISYDATVQELSDAIISKTDLDFTHLYGVRVLVEDWGGGGICENNTALITFFSPVDGAPELFDGLDTGANLEILTVDTTELAFDAGEGNVVVSELQAGTWRVHGLNSDQQQIGSAYIFRNIPPECDERAAHCRKTQWVQEAQFFPTVAAVGSEFGFSVSISGDVAVVGAPGSLEARGKVYIFTYDALYGVWSYLQTINDPLLEPGDRFGHSVSLDGDILVVGSPTAIASRGSMNVYKLTIVNGGLVFIPKQSLVPIVSSGYYPLTAGDLYGYSVSVSGNTLVVSAPHLNDRTLYLGRTQDSEQSRHSGAVFVYVRPDSNSDYKYFQHVLPSNVKLGDRFGHSVDIDGNTLIISSLEDFDGDYQPEKDIVSVVTRATYNELPLGGSFVLQWLSVNTTTSTPQTFTSRPIAHDARAAELRDILEEDLHTGPIRVWRSAADEYDGGYEWRITFLSRDSPVPLLESDTKELTGTDPYVEISYINQRPKRTRGLAHLFQQPSATELFVEELFLSPYKDQGNDLCGTAVAVSGKNALVGCPNRDQRYHNQNSGAAFIYHLGLLAVTLQSDANTGEVREGSVANLKVTFDPNHADARDEDVRFYFESLDRNANEYKQHFIRSLYGIDLNDLTYPETAIDRTKVCGDAIERTQSYGSSHKESRWVDGQYDYRGISDYVGVQYPNIFLVEADAAHNEVITTPDSVLEAPDETVMLGLNTPGIFPSILGRFVSELTIKDSRSEGSFGDGHVKGKTRYTKLYDDDFQSGAVTSRSASGVGSVLAIHDEIGVLFAGSPLQLSLAGKVTQYNKVNETWVQQGSALTSPSTDLAGYGPSGNRFGSSIALNRVFKRNISLLAIGEPGINRVHVYASTDESLGVAYAHEDTIVVDVNDNTLNPQYRMGEAGTLSLYGFMLVIGVPGLEVVYVYHRSYDEVALQWKWSLFKELYSINYDYDILAQGKISLHRENFGKAVTQAGRHIAIGAPFADYQNIATYLTEVNWQTEGTDIFATGKGRAYTYYITPTEQRIDLWAANSLLEGEFVLSFDYQGMAETTIPLSYDILIDDFKNALEDLRNIDEIAVSNSHFEDEDDDGTVYYRYSWTVTFISEFLEPPLLVPQWYETGCHACLNFSIGAPLQLNSDTGIAASDIRQVMVTNVVNTGELRYQQTLAPSDGRMGDRFGAALHMHEDELVIGAPYSAAVLISTWDFETGTLQGWTKSGTAFDFQPTWGDNSYYRAVYGSSVQESPTMLRSYGRSSGLGGKYFIGTFEKHPGDPLDYRIADATYPMGTAQGDGPIGTLTSDSFIVPKGGSTISFLIGGGCDLFTVYVELLVDGLSVAKQTGSCNEKMQPETFDVSLFVGRSVRIRIVDNSNSDIWGHINVDSFKFDWDINGATVVGNNGRNSTGGHVEYARSGGAYLFFLNDNVSYTEVCKSNEKSQCVWREIARFSASDKREGAEFGSSVAINVTSGIVAIGSPLAPLTGFYKEEPSVYPHRQIGDPYSAPSFDITTGLSSGAAMGIHFPITPDNMQVMESQPRYFPQRNGAGGVWSVGARNEAQKKATALVPPRPGIEGNNRGGAVYVFVKEHRTFTADGNILVDEFWSPLEHAKVQSPDEAAQDLFGSSVVLSDMTLLTGSPGQDGHEPDAGALYAFSLEFAAVSFEKEEFPIMENTNLRVATVIIHRDPSVYPGLIILEYATSDLTAYGVDEAKFTECQLLSLAERGPANCGDYMQTSGHVYIWPTDNSASFTVPIMDDICHERFMEFIQVTVSIPGSASLQGSVLSTRIRIDDDDYMKEACDF